MNAEDLAPYVTVQLLWDDDKTGDIRHMEASISRRRLADLLVELDAQDTEDADRG